MYIEFIGMPASGKSFYKNKIINIIKKRTISNKFYQIKKLLKIYFFLIFFIKYLKLTIINLNFFLFTKIKDREFKRHFYYFKNEAALRIYHEKKKEIIINDEGFRHRAIYFIFKNLKMDKNFLYKHYINLLPKIDLLIYIKSNKKLNIYRSKNRKNGFKYNLEEVKIYKDKEEIIKKIVKETGKKTLLLEFKNNHIQKNMNKFKRIIKKI